jgi:hypothetical protein
VLSGPSFSVLDDEGGSLTSFQADTLRFLQKVARNKPNELTFSLPLAPETRIIHHVCLKNVFGS